jgi:hypothetical protein
MWRIALHRALSLALGALLAGTAYWFGIDGLLSGTLGVALAAVALMLLWVRREFPDRQTGDGWTDGRWTGFSVAVANLGALVGLQSVPVSERYRVAVALLVLLVGLAGYAGGSVAEMERDRTRTEPDDSGAVPVDD